MIRRKIFKLCRSVIDSSSLQKYFSYGDPTFVQIMASAWADDYERQTINGIWELENWEGIMMPDGRNIVQQRVIRMYALYTART